MKYKEIIFSSKSNVHKQKFQGGLPLKISNDFNGKKWQELLSYRDFTLEKVNGVSSLSIYIHKTFSGSQNASFKPIFFYILGQ